MAGGVTIRPFVKTHVPTIVYAILIFVLSSIPSLRPIEIGLSFQDKLAHALEFGIFGFLLQRSFASMRPITWTVFGMTFIAGTMYAGLDELHQLFVAGRECSAADYLWDSVGLLCGQSVYAVVKKLHFFR